jgi:16S rRNA (guanine527-N7)-methyltransferase
MPNTAVTPDPRWAAQLATGLRALGLDLDEAQQDCLLRYLALLVKWNRAYNLTAVRDPAEMVSRQLLDSLSILPWVRGPRVLDVGSGAGLPGIPLAIARPGWALTLLDSNGKKTRFLTQVCLELGLANVVVVQARAEQYRPADQRGFDTVTARAFASLAQLLALTRHLLAPGGRWVAMKGPSEDPHSEALGKDLGVQVQALQVPGAAGVRRAVIIEPR